MPELEKTRQYNAAKMSTMIPRSPAPVEPAAPASTGVIRSLAQLLEAAEERGVSTELLRREAQDNRNFPLRLPLALLDRVEHWSMDDPILRQVLPSAAETQPVAGYGDDPVGEAGLQDGALLKKYAGRALLITTQACDVHCRYCFRRSFDYGVAQESDNYADAFARLTADDTVHELILSGGDPLTLSARRLQAIVEAAEQIPHLHTLRLHTRSAIVHPARVTPALLDLLAATRLHVVCVVHANTAQEIGPASAHALQQLNTAGVMLLNQAVLLAGVNDSVETLADLSRRLFACGVLPYYLHQLDPVAGAAHFPVSDGKARVMLDTLRAKLPGYLVPKLVRESAGEASKTPL